MRGLVHSYLFLRRAIGTLGLLLPLVLIAGGYLADGRVLSSISGYYYSPVRDIFVGAMCAIGVFLFSYRGYDRVDDLASDVAAVAAIGLALLPTTPPDPSEHAKLIGVLHLVFAGIFFLSLAYFCLVLFRKSDDPTPTPRKAARNRVYVACGLAIIGSLALIVASGPLGIPGELRPALWLETVATMAFGLAWLTKGEAILGDLSGERAPTEVSPAG
ncbi:DUF998 domain-containing protein [Actinokineospora bangkokensis]|uniref:DUF998 domain-containing protein n=1 Tax=Actinokineospora bangkokensis TaxID=1193682 RepID=A0A1Q9LNX5_9PSEU|nr:DUF998 domain-containing protein [Actinokineospora bangkokensis]OLR93715.1 DUF998 domain-containing protein [Actinokineospora bangkokensis]